MHAMSRTELKYKYVRFQSNFPILKLCYNVYHALSVFRFRKTRYNYY